VISNFKHFQSLIFKKKGLIDVFDKEYFGAIRIVMINKQSTNSVALKSKHNVPIYYFRKL